MPNEEQLMWFAHNLDHRIIQVKGPDAEKFLQGQLTCDVRALKDKAYLVGAHCTPKGRMISSFVLAARNGTEGDCIWLRVRTNLADTALAALQKYSVFSKVTLSLLDWQLLVLTHDAAKQLNISESSNAIVLQRGHLVELWSTAETVQTYLTRAEADRIPQIDQNDLESHWVDAGLADIEQATTDTFIPQMLNYDALEGISYKKGCYTGQEIIARMHYKGQAKKHLYRVRLSNPQNLEVGQALFDTQEASKTVATVLTLSKKSGHVDALVVANGSIADIETLFNTSGPMEVHWLTLPYAIP